MNDHNKYIDQFWEKFIRETGLSLTPISAIRYADGEPVQFDLGEHKSLYRFYEDESTRRRFCYTPWKCVRGYYWAFDYAPRGVGSRSGDPDRLVVVRSVKFRKRKAAKRRAHSRYLKATGKDKG